MGECPGKTHKRRFRRHDMGSVFRADMGAHSTKIDDGSTAFTHRGKSGVYAAKGPVENDVHDFPPFGETHIRDVLLAPQGRIVDENIDATERLHRSGSKPPRG